MYRTIEAIFRHPIQLLLLLLLPVVVSVAIAYKLPRTYQSAASLWALHRYAIIGATGPESDLLSTPSETQVSALSELLQSREFALLVAKSTDLASTLNIGQLDPQQRDDALSLEIAQHVLPVSKGYNLYEVSYSNRNPVVAQQVVAAVIQQFKQQGQGFSVVEGQHLLEGYQTQLEQAKHDTDVATQAEAQYLAAHPALKQAATTSVNDPQYALLDSKRLQAQATLQNIQNTIATISQQITLQSNSTDAFFQVLDPPILPDPSSRTKTFLTVGGVGAAVGLIACVLYILILVRRDRALYTIRDVQKVSAYPVLMQLPQLPPEMKSHTAQVIV